MLQHYSHVRSRAKPAAIPTLEEQAIAPVLPRHGQRSGLNGGNTKKVGTGIAAPLYGLSGRSPNIVPSQERLQRPLAILHRPSTEPAAQSVPVCLFYFAVQFTDR